MKKISIIFTIITASILLLNSCYRDSEESLYRFVPAYCDTTNVSFTAIISPIISANCISCHSGAGAGGGYQLDSYAGVKAIADNGKLVNSVTYVSNGMPRSGKMDNCNVNKIVAWVNRGALNN
ncbi:MAG: c-type cytochrome [Bacteroidales bacterium]